MPTFFPRSTEKNVVMVTRPRPPICTRRIITIRPKPLHWVAISTTPSPVTQVADVAVKSAVRKFTGGCPGLDAIGRLSKNAPQKITARKLNTIILVGSRDIYLLFLILNCSFTMYTTISLMINIKS
jgi:hypothetical protein